MIFKIGKYFFRILLLFIIILLGINYFVIFSTSDKIITDRSNKKLKNIDCILILGAGIKGNYPTPMLEDRLQTGIDLYEDNFSSKILVSGDHLKESHDEVGVMKDYLVGHKIPSQDIFMDHAGISTYDSIYRTKEIFGAKKIVIITQQYHLYRALYIAKQLDLEAVGIAPENKNYNGQGTREVREILARIKDFAKTILKPTSSYLGDPIPIDGNGDITND